MLAGLAAYGNVQSLLNISFFEIPCNVHDIAYNAGGTTADRLHADKLLYKIWSKKSSLAF